MGASAPDLGEAIRAYALDLGFDAIGFAPAHLGPEARARLADFLAAGQHGDMGWLADRTEARAHPQALWPEAKTVIALGLSYAPGFDALETLRRPERGNISVYARHRDYHDVLRGKLKHLAQHIVSRFGGGVKVFVDTAPVMEKPLAEAAGLGWQGKHTNLVSRAHGSWLFLGEVFTTLKIATSPPSGGSCGTCTRCLAICPTNAFPAPYRLDATRCISYLTIEHRGPIPLALRPLMGNRIYGCDDCLAVCPWNRFAREGRDHKLRARSDLAAPRLAELAALDDAGFRAMFSASPIKRIGRARFVRNVLNAIGNSAEPALREAARAGGGGCRPSGGGLRRLGGGTPGMLIKRSFSLAGHRTSVALEEAFWLALAAMAAREGLSLAALVMRLDGARAPETSLASALRLLALQDARTAARDGRSAQDRAFD